MKHILRSIIDVDGQIPQDSLLRNYSFFAQSAVSIANSEDTDIWDYIRNYAVDYSALPSIVTLHDFFEKNGESTVTDRLNEVQKFSKVYEFSDFENLVTQEVNQQKDQEMHIILKTGADILHGGLTIRRGRDDVTYKGHRGAMTYLMEHSEDMLASERGFRTRANLTLDTDAAKNEFETMLAADRTNWGVICGLSNIDNVCRGLKRGELWTHAAFTGELKTTFALNWAYRAVYLLQQNVYYLSLEMPIEQIRRIIYVMHANHPKFQGQGWPSINYRLIRDGEDENGPMTPEQIAFYYHIMQDIKENAGISYGNFITNAPPEDYNIEKLKADLEVQHQKAPLHMCVLDHFALMKPVKSTRDYYTDLNGIVRGVKRIALTFNNGEGIPILGLLQINRKGKDEATKAEGVYKMQALADSNEAERSSDVITTTYLDTDRRMHGMPKFGCLKNRDNPHFVPFDAHIEWGTRYIKDILLEETNLVDQLEAENREQLVGDLL